MTYEAFIDKLHRRWMENPDEYPTRSVYMSVRKYTNWIRIKPRSEGFTHHGCFASHVDPEDDVRCIDLEGDQATRCVPIMNSLLEAGINSIAIFTGTGVQLGFFSEEDAVAARAYLCT